MIKTSGLVRKSSNNYIHHIDTKEVRHDELTSIQGYKGNFTYKVWFKIYFKKISNFLAENQR